MEERVAKPKNIDEYISQFTESTQLLLIELRSVIQKAAPTAKEVINYGMPTFQLNGNLVHFAAFKKHIGFYPSPSGVVAFADEVTNYKTSKGAIQFPLNQSLPLELIDKIVKYRVKENLAKS
jgi:uncharacterized protein YdhG (YjbR/CyaY superfamily)